LAREGLQNEASRVSQVGRSVQLPSGRPIFALQVIGMKRRAVVGKRGRSPRAEGESDWHRCSLNREQTPLISAPNKLTFELDRWALSVERPSPRI